MTDPTACRSENANSNATGFHSKTVGRLLPASGSIAHFYSIFDLLQSVSALTPARVYGEKASLGAAGLYEMRGVCRNHCRCTFSASFGRAGAEWQTPPVERTMKMCDAR